jgi:hypothetical protein
VHLLVWKINVNFCLRYVHMNPLTAASYNMLGVHKFPQILGARSVIWSRFHTEAVPQILGATIQNLVVRMTWYQENVHPCWFICMSMVYVIMVLETQISSSCCRRVCFVKGELQRMWKERVLT